jgi:hypothetical protein
MSVYNRPLSRGSIVRIPQRSSSLRPILQPFFQHIKSSNPLEQPLIDPRHFEEEYGETLCVI